MKDCECRELKPSWCFYSRISVVEFFDLRKFIVNDRCEKTLPVIGARENSEKLYKIS